MYIVKHCELRMDIPFYKVTVLKVNVQFSDFSSKLDNGIFIKLLVTLGIYNSINIGKRLIAIKHF